jgi:hypothetical protein
VRSPEKMLKTLNFKSRKHSKEEAFSGTGVVVGESTKK